MPKSCGVILGAGLSLILVGCGATPAEPAPEPDHPPAIPAHSDWVECGPIFDAGTDGQWDRYLWGGFASTVVMRDGVFHLYYQGSTGYDEEEGTVTWRSIGLATSSDGFEFTKHAQNPILTWFPSPQLEEGAVSGGAFLDDAGDIAIYYGANTWAGGSEVSADGRLAVSPNGIEFTDLGVVLDRSDEAVWGSGDELFPIIGLQEDGLWLTYYIPNGVPEEGRLGVAWGDDRSRPSHSAQARSGTGPVSVWGPASAVRIEPGFYALFLNDVRAPGGPLIEVRTVSLHDPSELSAPVESYRFEGVWEAVVLLDRHTDTWFMFYRSDDQEHYGVKVAGGDGGGCRPGTAGRPS